MLFGHILLLNALQCDTKKVTVRSQSETESEIAVTVAPQNKRPFPAPIVISSSSYFRDAARKQTGKQTSRALLCFNEL